jgi:hypothetical protein
LEAVSKIHTFFFFGARFLGAAFSLGSAAAFFAGAFFLGFSSSSASLASAALLYIIDINYRTKI